MNPFDLKAQTWDDNPQRLQLTMAAAEEMKKSIPLSTRWHALDFGCGTGTLSFLLHTYLQEITLADESASMLEVLYSKIKNSNSQNMHTLNLAQQAIDTQFDLIYTMMALHHIENTQDILHSFNTYLKPGGYLCIIDLIEEDGSFHAEHPGFNGHNGFHLDTLTSILAKVGFTNIQSNLFYEMKRNEHIYPIFCMTALKP